MRIEKLRLFERRAARSRVTVSIGVAEFRMGESIGQTVARADEALYQAKSSGRNRVVSYGQALEPLALPCATATPGSTPDLGASVGRMLDSTRSTSSRACSTGACCATASATPWRAPCRNRAPGRR